MNILQKTYGKVEGHQTDDGIREHETAIQAVKDAMKEQKPVDLQVKGDGFYKICPHCKSRMIRDDSKVYTSMPPQYGYNCPKCGTMEFDTVMYDNPEMEEQKHAEWVLPEDFEEAVYKVANFISPFDNQEELRKTSHRFAEQLLSLAKKELDKPAKWSEEDEKMYARVVRRYTDYEGVIMRTKEESVANKMFNAMAQEEIWLKSLTERFNLQPKQEWSKEDEEIIEEVISDLCALKDWIVKYDANWLANPVLKNIGKRISWLKSLPQRFNLKPKNEWNEDYGKEDLRTRFAFYTYKDEDDVLYLSNVFVEETSRNKGFGTKILAAAEKVAETLGAINIRLKVKQDSPENDWYRKHGYGYMAFEGDYDWLEKSLKSI